jgi:hypothetical protein
MLTLEYMLNTCQRCNAATLRERLGLKLYCWKLFFGRSLKPSLYEVQAVSMVGGGKHLGAA